MIMSPEDQRIEALKAQLREAESQKQKIESSKKRLELSSGAIMKAYRKYRNEYRSILEQYGWKESTATKRGIKRPQTMLRDMERSVERMGDDMVSETISTVSQQERSTAPVTDGRMPDTRMVMADETPLD